MLIKQFRVLILRFLLCEIYAIKANIFWFADCVKNFSVGRYSGIYEPIGLNLVW